MSLLPRATLHSDSEHYKHKRLVLHVQQAVSEDPREQLEIVSPTSTHFYAYKYKWVVIRVQTVSPYKYKSLVLQIETIAPTIRNCLQL